jgi:hypothetical protein
MKKMKLFCGILIGIFVFLSCSSDDDNSNESNDIIIGKWRAIEKYESNQLVDLPICLPHIYTEYKVDNSVSGDKIISNEFPDECNSIIFDLGIVWENLGNDNYRIGQVNEQGNIYKIYREGNNLAEEHTDGITKIIYESYQ